MLSVIDALDGGEARTDGRCMLRDAGHMIYSSVGEVSGGGLLYAPTLKKSRRRIVGFLIFSLKRHKFRHNLYFH